MQSGPPRRRRARPVADAPIDELLGRVDELAKGWLLALLERAPLDRMPAILAGEMATDGPRLLDAVVRAIGDDNDLRRLDQDGALEPLAARAGEIAGAGGSADATAAAVDMLGEVVWAAVREELRAPDPDQIAELAERIGVIVGLVRTAALRRRGVARAPVGQAAAPAAPAEALAEPEAPATAAETEAPAMAAEPEAPATAAEPEAPATAAEPEPPATAAEPEPPATAEPEPSPKRLEAAPFPPQAPVAERRPLWVGAFEDELVRTERSGGNLSLLLAELEDADRLLSVESGIEATAMFGRFAQALRDAVRRQDILASESESRAWVIARDTARPGAQALAARIAAAVSAAPQWRGAPMSVTIGIAVVGEDGHDASSLIDVAEESRFAAAASGIAVVPSGPPPPEAP
ncbi:MAG TPA: diguanylate cyclase [Solirubrobacteraceae bacterium]|nr:diguanylate cyclase [Solirubrobacteraceae bacterium]